MFLQAGEGRFGIEKNGKGAGVEKKDDPGPTSYDVAGAHEKANAFRGKNVIDKSKRIMFCERVAKQNISPGPGKHQTHIKQLDKITLSPLASSRKRL